MEPPVAGHAQRPFPSPMTDRSAVDKPASENSRKLSDPVQYLPSVGGLRAQLLARLGIQRAADLLFFFPRSYEDVAPLQNVESFVENTRVSFVGTILEIDERVTQNGKHMLGAVVRGESGGFVRLLWFNQPFRKNDIRPNLRLMATGILRSTVLNWEMVQPQIVALGESENSIDQKPLPIYALTEGLKQVAVREIMRQNIPTLIPLVEEALPAEIRNRLEVPSLSQSLSDIHFPPNMEAATLARRRFKLQELLVLQLAIAWQRQNRERLAKAPICEATGKIHARILNRMPFQLTADQLRSIDEIGRDMSSEKPMNRLLQGDVGSGKTLVAQYAMLLCVAHGYQAALMAPTEVLAQQHAGTLAKSLASSRVRIGLLTGSLGRKDRLELLSKIAAGDVDLVVGTQALLSEELKFHKLGLVVVDEQHKFGVLQRAQLRTEDSQPHYLVLSATPIPRTIAMTSFGDLDVSTIRHKPPGRAAVHTYLGTYDNIESWWRFVDQQIASGRQAFVIAPRVGIRGQVMLDDETEGTEIASAEGLYEQLRKTTFAHRELAILHGRMDSDDKERVLGDFAAGKTQMLIATTVVEVGIDVPNATVMTIMDADRLGLSQLHQLRGRIARGTQAGFICAIASRGCDASDNERLKAFEGSDDGFRLAELDLQMRGPGDLLGTQQHGLPPLRIADLATDADLVLLAREVAREVLEKNPNLDSPELAKLLRQTLSRYGKSMQLSDIG
jgi:ATP-dependent DNA helicase RecG